MLLRKMLRDMKRNLAQFVSIFLVSMLGVAVYAGVNAEWQGMQAESDRYYARTNMADVWAAGAFMQDDAEKAEETKGVASAEGRLVFDAVASLPGGPVLRVNCTRENAVSLPLAVEGKTYDPKSDGIWLDADFAHAQGLAPGDTLELEAMGQKLKKTIQGLVIHPEYLYNVKDATELLPNHKTFGFAFLPADRLPGADTLGWNQLLFRLNGGADAGSVKAALENSLGKKAALVYTRETHPSVLMFRTEIEENRTIGEIFPVVFFLIAALSMLTTMTRLTAGQRTQAGTLRALGYSRRAVLFHYVSYGVWLGLAGGLLGLLVGPAIVPPVLFEMQKSTYTLPAWPAALSWTDFSAVAAAVLCCGLSSWLACRAELKETPAATLRPKPPKAGRHMAWEKGRLWGRLGFSVQWNLRDVVRSPFRSAMAVAGVAGCMALLLCALGMRDTIGGLSRELYGELYVYESKINVSETMPAEQLDALLRDFNGQAAQESAVDLKHENTTDTGFLTVLGEGGLVLFRDPSGKPLDLPEDGAAMTYKMAQSLGAKLGDTVTFRVAGGDAWRSVRVAAIYRTPMTQGIAMSRGAYEKLGGRMAATAVLSGQSAPDAQGRPGVLSVQRKASLIKSYDTLLESMLALVAILIAAAVILGAVVLYNLGTLSFTERTRELATLKVLGFFPRQIKRLLRMQNVWLTLLGAAAGIPAGYALVTAILSKITEDMDLQTNITALSVGVCVLGTVALSMLVNGLLARKVRSIDMVAPFKAVD